MSGKVLEIHENYIPYANIIFTNLKTEKKTGIISNEKDGAFSIELSSGDYILQVSVLGYSKYIKKYTFTTDTLLPDIILSEQSEQLDEVVIKTDMTKNIEHSANGMTINIQNDSLYKKISAIDILSLLPEVQISENGSIRLQGIPAKITIDGKPQRMSSSILMILLESMQGDQLKNIELMNTPSAKYSGRVQKVIDISLKKQQEDGIMVSFGTRVSNSDFSIGPFASVNYKTGDFVFTAITAPYSYYKRTRSFFINRKLLDNSVAFYEEQKDFTESNSGYNQYGVDYTINEKHSIFAGISLNNNSNKTNIDFVTNQFAFGTLTNQQFNYNINKSLGNAYTLDFSYRYDIGDRGSRLDFANSYGKNKKENNNLNTNEFIDSIDGTINYNQNRDNQAQVNVQYSTQLDYLIPLKDKKTKFEAGAKYDNLTITNANRFENFNSNNSTFEIDPKFTNKFEYNEQRYTSYLSFNSSHKKLKYSLGIRLEHTKTKSFSETINQVFSNNFTNFLPVIAIKYLTNKKQTSNISLSYRKGYNLPPYIQLNPFEIFVNSSTIKRGNPKINQSVFHLYKLGHTINNKYFLNFSANFYNNQFETTQFLEDQITVISYQNLGRRELYKFDASTKFNLFSWWRLNVHGGVNYNFLKSDIVNNENLNINFGLNNSFTISDTFILRFNTRFSNGDSHGLDAPNKFIRTFSNISLSKRFLKNRASARVSVSDIFGMSNKNESTYIINNTSFSQRTELQKPSINFNFSYNFSSGKKISKRSKKSTGVDSSRL